MAHELPRAPFAFLAAAAVLGLVVWLRGRAREDAAPPPEPPASVATTAEPTTVAPAAPSSPPSPFESGTPTAAPAPPSVPVVEGTSGAEPTLADVSSAARKAIKAEVRRCNPGRPITAAIKNRRVVFYFTQLVSGGKVSLVNILKIDSDLDDNRLESCILNRVADVRLSAPGASDASSRLQETVDLADLAPTP